MYSPSHIPLAFVLVLAGMIPAAAQPVDVCEALGRAGKFAVVTAGTFDARPVLVRGVVPAWSAPTIGSVCAQRGLLAQTLLDGDFVSPLATGAGLVLRKPPAAPAQATRVNFVITGGAGASGGQYGT